MASLAEGAAGGRAPTALGCLGVAVTADRAPRDTSGAARRPLRVLAVMPTLDASGGAEQSIAALAPLLGRHDIDLHIVVLTGQSGLGACLVGQGIAVTALGTTLPAARYRHRVLGLRRLIRSVKPDVVHATLHEATIAAAPAVLGTRARLLVTWANTPLEAGEHAGLVPLRVWLRHTVEIAATTVTRARFHAVTEGVAQTCRRRYHVSARRVRVAERGRDARRFGPLSPTELAALRGSLNLDPQQRVLLAVGRVAPQKNHLALLEAFDSVADQHPDAVLLIAGEKGSAWGLVSEAAASHRFSNRIHLLGQRDDIPVLLQIASAIVCSSQREGAAGALIEAMASGTPIVSCRLEGLEGVLEHGRNAVVVESDQLAAGICSVLDDPGAAHRRADTARSDFEQRFTLERAAESLAGVYRWAGD